MKGGGRDRGVRIDKWTVGGGAQTKACVYQNSSSTERAICTSGASKEDASWGWVVTFMYSDHIKR